MTAADRTVALLRAIDVAARDDSAFGAPDIPFPLATLHLSECLRLIVRIRPGVAAMAETYAARAAEELGLVEREP